MNFPPSPIVQWSSIIALLAALVLTFRPNDGRIKTAAALWCIGVLGMHGERTVEVIRIGITPPLLSDSLLFDLFLFTLSLSPSLFALGGSILMHPAIPQKRALWIARIVIGLASPFYFLFATALLFSWFFAVLLPPLRESLFSLLWIFYVWLWFRIRRQFDIKPEPSLDEPS